MRFNFSKYHGAGNDFILIDGRDLTREIDADEKAYLCHRHFGIGADGIIIVQPDDELDFRMEYYNADGSVGGMCSNGSRCALAFAQNIGYEFKTARFSCCDVLYKGHLYEDDLIGTEFPNLKPGEFYDMGYFIDTGAPHLVIFKTDFLGLDPREEGRKWRYDKQFPVGTNVNFIQSTDRFHLEVMTYERGVEDVTLACGTGSLASAIGYLEREKLMGEHAIDVESDGGILKVKLTRSEDFITDIEVIGPYKLVFQAEIETQKLSMS